jgi:predicted Zn-ribbon and HTH transcriptional regulator
MRPILDPVKCKKCGYEWRPWFKDPKECPKCKSRKWTEKRIYKVK